MLNANATANKINDAMKDYKSNYDANKPFAFIDILSKILDEAFQEATLSSSNVTLSNMKDTLKLPHVTGTTAAMLIATAISEYWAGTTSTNGTPLNLCGPGSTILSVANTSATIIPTITSGILALSGKSEAETTPYLGFCNAIFNPIKTIVWTVTETNIMITPPCIMPTVVTVS